MGGGVVVRGTKGEIECDLRRAEISVSKVLNRSNDNLSCSFGCETGGDAAGELREDCVF